MSDAHREIERLLHEYAAAIDAGDFDAVGSLFADGAVCAPDGATMAEGADAVTRLYESTTRRYPDGTPRTRHVITNVIVDVEGDGASARCRSRFTVYQATETLPLQAIIVGDYEDEFASMDGRWAFRRRVMKPALYGDLSQHLLIDEHRGGATTP